MDKAAQMFAPGTEISLEGKTAEGTGTNGPVLRLNRHSVAFEMYAPEPAVRISEVLNPLELFVNGRMIFSGKGVVSALINTGSMLVCEATLDDGWREVSIASVLEKPGVALQSAFAGFMQQWHKTYRIMPDFKVVVTDMRSFLMDLRSWLDQIQLGIQSDPCSDQARLELGTAAKLGEATTPALTGLFERFEDTMQHVPEESQAVHGAFARRQLHPLLLCAPFLNRTFRKPLGYAGDYEMVNMICRNPLEGGTLFAKLVNLWFVQQPPAEAHRNRIEFLIQRITEAAAIASARREKARILSVGCGPAIEVQRFLKEKEFCNQAEFTLLDFNTETLEYAESTLQRIRHEHQRSTKIEFVRRSVNQIIKDSAKHIQEAVPRYDLVYCAGLFDYLSAQACRRLSNILYDWVTPGGCLITTNVHSSNPRQPTMDYIMEWHLLYRSAAELAALKPEVVTSNDFAVSSDQTGVNIYFEARKRGRGEQ